MDERLSTYLESEAFKFQLNEFFEMFNHKGYCGEANLPFHSEVVERFQNTDWKANLNKRLLPDMLALFFDRGHYKNNRQLFAVIFGYANNLTPKQMLRISDRRSANRSWKILDYFLCHRDRESYKVKDLVPCSTLTYTVVKGDATYKAVLKKSDTLTDSDCLYIEASGAGVFLKIK